MFEKHNIRLAELPGVAKALIEMFGQQRIFCFYGKMGAGKTTLIQSICAALKSSDIVTSPTFSIVNEYETSGNGTIYHFDFYRIKNSDEALDMGYEDYFFSGNYCMVEWPERIDTLLPDQLVEVIMSVEDDETRSITARLTKNEF